MSKRKKTDTTKKDLLPVFLIAAFSCFVMPLLYFKSTLDPVLYPRFLAWSMVTFMLVAVLWVRIKNKKLEFYKFPQSIWVAFLIFISITFLTLLPSINPYEGLTDLFKWLLFFIFTIVGYQVFTNFERSISILLKAVVVYAIIALIIGFYQYIKFALTSNDVNAIYEVKGLMAHKNQYSISLFLLLPFLVSSLFILPKSWKFANIVSIGLIAIILAILQTRAVWIAVIFSGFLTSCFLIFKFNSEIKLFFLKKSGKRTGLIVFGFAILVIIGGLLFPDFVIYEKFVTRIASIFNPDYTSNEWRIEMWNATYHLFLDNWLSGVGGGNWKIAIYPYYSDYLPSVYRHWRTPHNDYLEVAAEKGIAGLLSYLSIFILVLYYGIRNIFKSVNSKSALISGALVFGIFGYLCIAFFSFPGTRVNHSVFLSIMMAMVLVYNSKRKRLQKHLYKSQWKIYFIISLLVLYLPLHFGIICVNSELNLAKVKVYNDKKDWKNVKRYANRAYSQFAPIEPVSSLPVIFYKGLAEFGIGNFPEANTHFMQAYSKHPNNISVLNNIGGTYGELKKFDSAIVYYEKALDIFPHYEYSLLNSAKAYYLNGDLVNAYKLILACDPGSKDKEINKFRAFIEGKLD